MVFTNAKGIYNPSINEWVDTKQGTHEAKATSDSIISLELIIIMNRIIDLSFCDILFRY